MGAQPVSTEKKNWGIPSEIRVAVVAQPVSTEKKNRGIPSEIMVAVVAQPVSTILGYLPNYTFGNQGCSGCSTGFNRKKKLGYTFGNQGCSGCSTGFNQKKIWVYLRKSGLQWLLNRFQPKKNLGIPSKIRVAVVAQPVSTEKKKLGIPSKIRVAVVAQPVSTIPGSLPNYTFGNQGCSGCSTGFNRKKKLGYTFENPGSSGCSTGFKQKKNWGIPSKI